MRGGRGAVSDVGGGGSFLCVFWCVCVFFVAGAAPLQACCMLGYGSSTPLPPLETPQLPGRRCTLQVTVSVVSDDKGHSHTEVSVACRQFDIRRNGASTAGGGQAEGVDPGAAALYIRCVLDLCRELGELLSQ